MLFSYLFQNNLQIIAPMIAAVQTTTKASRRSNGFVVLLLFFIICEANHCAFAGNRQSTSTIRQAIEDPDGAMLNFYNFLQQADQGLETARIIHYGDSHVAADILTATLRRKLQQRFGDAGTGFVLAGKPWTWYSRRGIQSFTSDGWRVVGLGQATSLSSGQFGLAGVSLTTERADQWLSIESLCNRFDIYLMKQPDGGVIDVLLDGEVIYPKVSLSSKEAQAFYLTIDAKTDGSHLLEIRTTRSGAVKIFGIAVEQNRAGIVYDVLGINGARIYRPLNWDWQILADNLEHRAPALIIIAYGSNEIGDKDLDLEEYSEKFSELLERLQTAVPEASLLVIAPPERAAPVRGVWKPLPQMSALVATQRKVALKSGAAFWNLFQAMGGTGSIEHWHKRSLAQADRVHLTSAGYQMVAEMLYAELINGYQTVLHRKRDRQ
jgi:lysophospholipase L1-like esterase